MQAAAGAITAHLMASANLPGPQVLEYLQLVQLHVLQNHNMQDYLQNLLPLSLPAASKVRERSETGVGPSSKRPKVSTEPLRLAEDLKGKLSEASVPKKMWRVLDDSNLLTVEAVREMLSCVGTDARASAAVALREKLNTSLYSITNAVALTPVEPAIQKPMVEPPLVGSHLKDAIAHGRQQFLVYSDGTPSATAVEMDTPYTTRLQMLEDGHMSKRGLSMLALPATPSSPFSAVLASLTACAVYEDEEFPAKKSPELSFPFLQKSALGSSLVVIVIEDESLRSRKAETVPLKTTWECADLSIPAPVEGVKALRAIIAAFAVDNATTDRVQSAINSHSSANAAAYSNAILSSDTMPTMADVALLAHVLELSVRITSIDKESSITEPICIITGAGVIIDLVVAEMSNGGRQRWYGTIPAAKQRVSYDPSRGYFSFASKTALESATTEVVAVVNDAGGLLNPYVVHPDVRNHTTAPALLKLDGGVKSFLVTYPLLDKGSPVQSDNAGLHKMLASLAAPPGSLLKPPTPLHVHAKLGWGMKESELKARHSNGTTLKTTAKSFTYHNEGDIETLSQKVSEDEASGSPVGDAEFFAVCKSTKDNESRQNESNPCNSLEILAVVTFCSIKCDEASDVGWIFYTYRADDRPLTPLDVTALEHAAKRMKECNLADVWCFVPSEILRESLNTLGFQPYNGTEAGAPSLKWYSATTKGTLMSANTTDLCRKADEWREADLERDEAGGKKRQRLSSGKLSLISRVQAESVEVPQLQSFFAAAARAARR